MPAIKLNKNFILLSVILLLAGAPLFALSVTHGPYLYDMSDTAVTVIWHTDVNCMASVIYGQNNQLNNEAVETRQWVRKVGKRHNVRLLGLRPGETYQYSIVSTEITKYAPLFPTLGNSVTGNVHELTTFNTMKTSFSFYYMTDLHNNAKWINMLLDSVDLGAADFVAFGGDCANDMSSTDSKIYNSLLDPITNHFGSEKPFVYTRGNHEMRGSINQVLLEHIPNSFGTYYFSFSHGPAHFFVFDSGEDKADASAVFTDLVRGEDYMANQLAWWRSYMNKEQARLATLPFRIAFVHQPYWSDKNSSSWYSLANDTKIDLALSGHTHGFRYSEPGQTSSYHRLTLGQAQIAKITVDSDKLSGTTWDHESNVVGTFSFNAKDNPLSTTSARAKQTGGLLKVFSLDGQSYTLPQEFAGKMKSVSIFNLNGKRVYQTVTDNQAVLLNEIPEFKGGIYFVQVIPVP